MGRSDTFAPKAYLREWDLEWRNCGFGKMKKEAHPERLRAAVEQDAKLKRTQKQESNLRGGNPRQLFISQMDAARENAWAKRTWSDYMEDKRKLGVLWDSLPCDDARKVAARRDFATAVERQRFPALVPQEELPSLPRSEGAAVRATPWGVGSCLEGGAKHAFGHLNKTGFGAPKGLFLNSLKGLKQCCFRIKTSTVAKKRALWQLGLL